MPLVTLTLLGGFELRIGAKVLPLSRKAEALLAYLALTSAPAHSRSKLAALLWGDTTDDDARNSLRQVLFRVRRALGRASRILTINGELVGLDQQSVQTDVATFLQLVIDGSDEALRAAADLYRGSLLEGLDTGESAFEDWLGGERERLQEIAVAAFLRLIAGSEKQRAVDGVVTAGLKVLGLDPLNEEAHRALMRAYASQGRRAAALRQYQMCLDVLQRELQVKPEPETKALYLELLRQPPSTPVVASVATFARSEPSGMSRPPLTGRAAELGQLAGDLEQALSGTTRIAAVFGEAGVGKTRLVEELLAVAVSRGCIALQARAYESEESLPFALWVTALRSAGLVEDRALIERLGSEWRDALNPLFRELPGRRRRGSVETENQLRLFEALSRLVATVAMSQPLVVVLEDLQWADATSLRFLAFLGRRLRKDHVCLVITARPEETGGRSEKVLGTILSELRRDGRLSEITLSPLT